MLLHAPGDCLMQQLINGVSADAWRRIWRKTRGQDRVYWVIEAGGGGMRTRVDRAWKEIDREVRRVFDPGAREEG